jgi:hypothetical protein
MLIQAVLSATWIQLFDERHGLVLGSSNLAGAHYERLVRTDDGGMVQPRSVAAFPDRDHGWYLAGEIAGAGPKDLSGTGPTTGECTGAGLNPWTSCIRQITG